MKRTPGHGHPRCARGRGSCDGRRQQPALQAGQRLLHADQRRPEDRRPVLHEADGAGELPMLYTADRKFFAKTGANTTGKVDAPGPNADWLVEGGSGDYHLSVGGSKLTAADPCSRLVPVRRSPSAGRRLRDVPGGRAGRHRHAAAGARRRTARTSGLIDAHMHMMAFEFLGGDAHCGRPWAPLRRHRRAGRLPRPRGPAARARRRERVSAATRRATHDPVGWPTFKRLAATTTR